MVVHPNGGISGTIGGGAVEGDVIQRAIGLFDTGGAEIVSYDLNRSVNVEQMDLICGGRLQVLIEHVPDHKKNIGLYHSAQEELRKSRCFFWIAKITDHNSQLKVERALQKSQNIFMGPIQIKDELHNLIKSNPRFSNGSHFIEIDEKAYLIEVIKPPEKIFLFGAGHVSKEIAALSKKVGFCIIVFDDRIEFANEDRFPDADEILVCPEFSEVFKAFDTNEGDYIVIVTRGHRFDKEVLAQALRTKAGYIGMIGSRKKRDTIYKKLMNKGFKKSALEQVHCPIGLSINAETPAEIAVSVVAQLIQQRANRKTHG
jgi:xanthine dehydrogenase accessory factor